MAIERVTEHPDGSRTIERQEAQQGAPAEPRSHGPGGIIMALALLLAVAIAGVFFINMSRQETLRTEAVSEAAESVTDAASEAAEGVTEAAGRAADAVTP